METQSSRQALRAGTIHGVLHNHLRGILLVPTIRFTTTGASRPVHTVQMEKNNTKESRPIETSSMGHIRFCRSLQQHNRVWASNNFLTWLPIWWSMSRTTSYLRSTIVYPNVPLILWHDINSPYRSNQIRDQSAHLQIVNGLNGHIYWRDWQRREGSQQECSIMVKSSSSSRYWKTPWRWDMHLHINHDH